MSVEYRTARPADAAALRTLFAESFIETFGHLYRPPDLEEFLATNSMEKWHANLTDPQVAIQVAEMDGEIAGFVELAPQKLPYESALPVIELRRLYLRSKGHGLGIADALMDWAVDEARTRGAEEMILSVYVDNHRARRFYERRGFEVVGKYDFMVGSHADEDLILRHVIMRAHG